LPFGDDVSIVVINLVPVQILPNASTVEFADSNVAYAGVVGRAVAVDVFMGGNVVNEKVAGVDGFSKTRGV
jgi:hypothetical protein